MSTLEIFCLISGVIMVCVVAANIFLYVFGRKKVKRDTGTSETSEVAVNEDETVIASDAVEQSFNGAVAQTSDKKHTYLRYNKSFKAKLIQASDEVREYYNRLKNFAAGYKNVSFSISWKQESVSRVKDKICRFILSRNSLCAYLPLNPDDYADTKYNVEFAKAKCFKNFPCKYRVNNSQQAEYATELIATVMERYGIEREDKPAENFVAEYPYEETSSLIERGLIKVRR